MVWTNQAYGSGLQNQSENLIQFKHKIENFKNTAIFYTDDVQGLYYLQEFLLRPLATLRLAILPHS